MQAKCGRYRSLKNGRHAAFFVEYQVLVLDDPEYVAETGQAVHGWWGPCCVECLR